MDVTQEEAEEMTRRLASERGIFAGISSGGRLPPRWLWPQHLSMRLSLPLSATAVTATFLLVFFLLNEGISPHWQSLSSVCLSTGQAFSCRSVQAAAEHSTAGLAPKRSTEHPLVGWTKGFLFIVGRTLCPYGTLISLLSPKSNATEVL